MLSDGSVLVMGGCTSSNCYSNEVWKSWDGGVQWTLLSDAAWTGEYKLKLYVIQHAAANFILCAGRYGHGSVVLEDGSVLVLGGDTANYLY